MKNSKIAFTSFLAIFLLTCLSFATGNGHMHDHGKMEHMAKDKKRISLDPTVKESVIEVLKANEELHQAFYNYDGKKLEKAATNLNKIMAQVKDKKIKKMLEFSQEKLANIKASNDRKVNDKNYNLVSMAVIHLINTYDVGNDYNSYSCPMVKKKWIQNTKKYSKIENPYSPDMPNCGSKTSDFK